MEHVEIRRAPTTKTLHMLFDQDQEVSLVCKKFKNYANNIQNINLMCDNGNFVILNNGIIKVLNIICKTKYFGLLRIDKVFFSIRNYYKDVLSLARCDPNQNKIFIQGFPKKCPLVLEGRSTPKF